MQNVANFIDKVLVIIIQNHNVAVDNFQDSVNLFAFVSFELYFVDTKR